MKVYYTFNQRSFLRIKPCESSKAPQNAALDSTCNHTKQENIMGHAITILNGKKYSTDFYNRFSSKTTVKGNHSQMDAAKNLMDDNKYVRNTSLKAPSLFSSIFKNTMRAWICHHNYGHIFG